MNDQRLPPVNLPVLTDVVASDDPEVVLPASSAVVLPLRAVQDHGGTPGAQATASSSAVAEFDTQALTEEVLVEVQRQVNRMYEYRVRDALGPVLEKLAQDFVVAAREELASTLHDIVHKAVNQALARRRNSESDR